MRRCKFDAPLLAVGLLTSLRQDYSLKEEFRNETVRQYFISDVLEIPLEEIRSVRLHDTFLWTRHKKQKQGILEAIKEINIMNLGKRLRAIHEFNLREQRDKAALEEQIRRDAGAQGLAEGRAKGLAEGLA